MLTGVFRAAKKNGTIYYRSSITYQNKHISLGSFSTEQDAHLAYLSAQELLSDTKITIDTVSFTHYPLDFEKIVSLLNFRDNKIYFKTPIYLRSNFFDYYLSPHTDLKFDIDDLFYYSSHRILKKNNHLYVNDYGMQYSILNRYGIKNYSVAGQDYLFSNGDSNDYRYSNIIIINKYNGVSKIQKPGAVLYRTRIHINGNYLVGTYSNEIEAAIAYNKAIDEARRYGIDRNYQENYIEDLGPRQYADIYTSIKLSRNYLRYLKANCSDSSL